MPLQGRLSIEHMCQLVAVSRRGFYRSLRQREPAEEETEEQLSTNIEEFIEEYCNRQRLHSALGYRYPEEFKQESEQRNSAASLGATVQFIVNDGNSQNEERASPDPNSC